MKKYALIRDNKIVKFKNVPDDDIVIVPKLLAHDYKIVEEQIIPKHDYITQSFLDIYEIQKDKVLRVWTVTERAFEEAKKIKQDIVEQKALDDIKIVFESSNQKEKIDNILANKDAEVVKIETAKSNTDLRKIEYIEEIKVVK